MFVSLIAREKVSESDLNALLIIFNNLYFYITNGAWKYLHLYLFVIARLIKRFIFAGITAQNKTKIIS